MVYDHQPEVGQSTWCMQYMVIIKMAAMASSNKVTHVHVHVCQHYTCACFVTLPQPLLVNSRQKTKDIYIHRGQFMSYLIHHVHKNSESQWYIVFYSNGGVRRKGTRDIGDAFIGMSPLPPVLSIIITVMFM